MKDGEPAFDKCTKKKKYISRDNKLDTKRWNVVEKEKRKGTNIALQFGYAMKLVAKKKWFFI